MVVDRRIFRRFVLLSEFVGRVNEIVRDAGMLSLEELIQNGNRLFRIFQGCVMVSRRCRQRERMETDAS